MLVKVSGGPWKIIFCNVHYLLFCFMQTTNLSRSLSWGYKAGRRLGWCDSFRNVLPLSITGTISLARRLSSLIFCTHLACNDSESAWAGVLRVPPVMLPVRTNLNRESSSLHVHFETYMTWKTIAKPADTIVFKYRFIRILCRRPIFITSVGTLYGRFRHNIENSLKRT